MNESAESARIDPYVVELSGEEPESILDHATAAYMPTQVTTAPHGHGPVTRVLLSGHPAQRVTSRVETPCDDRRHSISSDRLIRWILEPHLLRMTRFLRHVI